MTVQLTPDQIRARFAAANAVANENFNGLPAGQYYMRLDKAEIGKSKAGNEQIVHTFQVISGDFAKKSHKMFTGLDNETGMGIMFRMWRMLGYDTNGIGSNEELKAYCDQITTDKLHVMATITKSIGNNGTEYTNTKIDSIVEAPVVKPTVTVTPAAVAKPVATASPVPAKPVAAKPAPAPTPEPEAEVEAEVEPEAEVEDVNVTIDVGTKIKFKYKDSSLEGVVKVLGVDGDDTKLKVSSGGKLYTIASDKIEDVI